MSRLMILATAANFYPRPPRGGRLSPRIGRPKSDNPFLPTPSARRATISKNCQLAGIKFLPTPSARRATLRSDNADGSPLVFLPTPSARRATARVDPTTADLKISTHALREEGDCRSAQTSRPQGYFYPRPPRGGRREMARFEANSGVFLPTPSARRATANVP